MQGQRRAFLGFLGATVLIAALPALAVPPRPTADDAETIKVRVYEALLKNREPDFQPHFKTSDWIKGNRQFRIVQPWNVKSLVTRLSDWNTFGYMRRSDVSKAGPLSPRLEQRVWKMLENVNPLLRKRKPKKIDNHQSIEVGPIYTNGSDEAVVEAFTSDYFDDKTLGDNGGGSFGGYIFRLKKHGNTWKVENTTHTAAAG
jgi:hypothetical protein